jgi:hypothetical protein
MNPQVCHVWNGEKRQVGKFQQYVDTAPQERAECGSLLPTTPGTGGWGVAFQPPRLTSTLRVERPKREPDQRLSGWLPDRRRGPSWSRVGTLPEPAGSAEQLNLGAP